jgi:hypothetical protein
LLLLLFPLAASCMVLPLLTVASCLVLAAAC